MFEIQNIKEKIKALPEDIRSYLTSMKAAEVNAQIFAAAQVETTKQTELTFLIAGIILKEIPLSSLEAKLTEALAWPTEKISALAQEIVGSRLLMCDKWLGGEAEKYLLSRRTDISRYAAIISEQQAAIYKEEELFKMEEIEQSKEEAIIEQKEEESINDVLDDSQPVNEEIDENKEKKSLLNSLRSGLMVILETDDQAILDRYNYLFVFIWSVDEGFRVEAPTALMSNKEKISSAKMEIDGKPQSITISSILKDFVKNYGGEIDDLHIAEYMSSVALKSLSDEEKVIALRILKFYKNINILDEYLSKEIDEIGYNFAVLPAPAAIPVPAPTTPKKVKKATSPSPVSSKPIPTISKTQGLAAELEMMLKDYSPDSLEYKTIKQELKKLSLAK